MMTGTNPAVAILHDWILQGHLSEDEAVGAISMLPATVKTPTKELVSTLMVCSFNIFHRGCANHGTVSSRIS